ncbi:MAG TPA: hydantoinase B/oxoprolinase family protein, partial [bacterium]|nr:hydantoinase B/oxoprolinase family protein [bacterium]
RRDYFFPGHAPSYSILSDRAKFAPWGLFGGLDGRPAHYILNPDGVAKELPSKITFALKAGDVVSVQTPGGGGCGHPFERDAERVAADIAMGRVSLQRARDVYGVVVDPGSGAVDTEQTLALRIRR